MRKLVSGLAMGLLVLATGHVVYAGCGSQAGDEQAVIDARNAAASTCNCATAANHGAYVKCVAGVANSRAMNNQLPKNCTGAVKKCAAHSACGKPGFVTCCITKGTTTKCKVAKDSATCTGKGGTPTMDPDNTSCCSNSHPLTQNACMASPSGAFLN